MTSTTLYLEHFQLNRDPFDQEPDTSIFFPAGEREGILQNLLADIESGKPLIKLTGSEGTGKTLMCRLLEESLDLEKFLFVSIEHPIGSYDDFLRTVCIALGTVEEEYEDEDTVAPDYTLLFIEHLKQIELEGRNLVLIVDEAEHLFLATLERLIRLLCDTDNFRNLKLLLVGRLDLDVNLEQLAIYCSNVDVNSGYTLEALNQQETLEYIHFRLRGAGVIEEKLRTVFTEDAIEMLYQAAKGNISLTNSLAEQGMKKACEQGMFQVDDALIQSQQSLEENVSFAMFQGYDFVRDNKWWLLLGAFLVWGLLILIWPAGDHQDERPSSDEQLKVIVPEEEIIIPPEPDAPEIGVLEEIPEVSDAVEQQKKVEEQEQQLPSKPQVKVPEKDKEQVIEVRPLEQAETISDKKEIVIEPGKKKKVITEQPPSQKKETSASRNADALFRERTKASSSWVAWAYRGGYTIQLMVLASETAEDNLKKILVDDKYYPIRNHLYILKKNSPKTIYLFYGNYSSMDEAKKVRNKMPPFLRANQPYVLSIQDALDKTKQ